MGLFDLYISVFTRMYDPLPPSSPSRFCIRDCIKLRFVIRFHNNKYNVNKTHSSRMRTARCRRCMGGGLRSPSTETPSQDRDPLPGQRPPPRTETPSQDRDPLPHQGRDPLPPVNRRNMSKTLPSRHFVSRGVKFIHYILFNWVHENRA